MSEANFSTKPAISSQFAFESYGVGISIVCSSAALAADAYSVACKSLLNKMQSIELSGASQNFELVLDDSRIYRILLNGEEIGSAESLPVFLKFFDSMVRVTVAEHAKDLIFLHAGAVGWKGKALIFPANSYQGKSTLVAELVKNGAEYYSDDYAILDIEGLLHPFPRPLSIRTGEIGSTPTEISAETLGGSVGEAPIPVGLILFTRYEKDAIWTPEILSPGRGLLEMVPFNISMKEKPDFSLRVLNNIASRAIIASSCRGSAVEFVKTLLDFVDKTVS